MLALGVATSLCFTPATARLPVNEQAYARIAAQNLPPSLQAAAIELGARKIAKEKIPQWRDKRASGSAIYREMQHSRETHEPVASVPTSWSTVPTILDEMAIDDPDPSDVIRDPPLAGLGEALIDMHHRRQQDAILYCEFVSANFKRILKRQGS